MGIRCVLCSAVNLLLGSPAVARLRANRTRSQVLFKAVPMKIRLYLKLTRLCGCVLLLVLVATIHAQERTENVFEKVPLELRPRLIERLKEYIRCERTRQYEKLYEFLYDRDDKGKEIYSKTRGEAEDRRGVVQEFMPTFILDTTLDDGDAPTLFLTGPAKLFLKGHIVKKEMSIEARFHDGEWYFSELLESYLHID